MFLPSCHLKRNQRSIINICTTNEVERKTIWEILIAAIATVADINLNDCSDRSRYGRCGS